MLIIRKKELINISILYYIPDYTHLLNEFHFQDEDISPEFPRVHRFLNYWKSNINAVIKEVRVCSINNNYNNSIFFERIQ